MDSRASGVSGFAFQGTNAHVILRSQAAKQHVSEGLASLLARNDRPAYIAQLRPSCSLQPEIMLSKQKQYFPSTGYAAGCQMAPVLHRLQFWYLPEPHHFLSGFDKHGSPLAFDVDLSTPALAYIWEHQV